MLLQKYYLHILFLLFSFSLFSDASSQEPKLMLPVGHTAVITVIQFSPACPNDPIGGKKIVTGSRDKTIKIWETKTGKLLADLKGHTGEIKTLFFNVIGNRILTTASLDTNARLWNAETGELVKTISTGKSQVEYAIFSPDGNMVIANTSNNKPRIYSAATGLPLVSLKDSYKDIKTAMFSPDSKKLLVNYAYENTPVIYDPGTGEGLVNLAGHSSFIQCVAYCPDGQLVATSSYDKTVKIWDARSGKLIHTITGLQDMVYTITISHDSKLMATTTLGSKTAKLWDIGTGTFIADLNNDWTIESVNFSPDSRSVLTASFASTNAWDAVTGKPKLSGTYEGKPGKYHPLRNAFIINKENTTHLIDDKTGDSKVVLDSDEKIPLVQFSPGGEKLAGTVEQSKNVVIWDMGTGKRLVKLLGLTKGVDHAYLSNDSSFIVTESYQHASIWKINNNLLSPLLDPVNENVKFLRYSPDGKIMVAIKNTGENEVSLWNARSLAPINPNLWKKGIQNISTYHDGSFVFSADNSKLFISNHDWGSYVFDGKTGDLISKISHERVWLTRINASASRFLSYSDGKLTLTDIIAQKPINTWEIKEHTNEVEFLGTPGRLLSTGADQFNVFDENKKQPVLQIPFGTSLLNRDKDKLVVWSNTTQDMIMIWDLQKLKLQTTIKREKELMEEALWDVAWSFDQKSVLYSTNRGKVVVLDANSGTRSKEFDGFAKRLLFSVDGKYLFGIDGENVSLFDTKDYHLISQLKGHYNDVTSVVPLPDPTKVLTVSADNTAKVWDIATGKLLYTILTMDRDHEFKVIPGGYYTSNQAATKLLHYVTRNLKVISFEQLDVKYNRPDKVLQAIGNTDTALVRSYRKAWEKRIKRLGIDTTAFRDGYSVPEADLQNRDAIEYDQKTEKLTLHIKGVDSAFKLDRFNVWVNEAPVYGQRGISIRKKNVNNVDTTITIKLSQGENRIETSITNLNGTESYRMPLIVNYTAAAKQKETVRFIGIGIDKFADNKYDLQYSAKDIRDLSLKLKEKYGDNIIIDTLFNENVTVSNVKALKKRLQQTTENDKVIIAYSGHGMLSKDFDYYLSTYSVNFDKPEENGLPYDELENLLDSIPARKKLLLIDACHSGEVDKEDLIALNSTSDTLIKGLKPVAYKKEGQLGLKNSFELMQSLFVNVGKSTGATIISAAAGTQFALESNNLKNGVFTYCILDAMNIYPSMKISKLKKIVGERVVELTKGLQKPTSRAETIAVDWEVW